MPVVVLCSNVRRYATISDVQLGRHYSHTCNADGFAVLWILGISRYLVVYPGNKLYTIQNQHPPMNVLPMYEVVAQSVMALLPLAANV